MRAFFIAVSLALLSCGSDSSTESPPAGTGGTADAGIGGAAGTAGSAGASGGAAGAAGAAGSSGAAGDSGTCPSGDAGQWLDIAYAAIDGVAPNLLGLDIYAPARADHCKLAPVVVWVHGGGWAIGDKGNKMADKKALFLGDGYVLVSMNYRLSPDPAALDDPKRVMYPIHEQDVATGLSWLHDHIAEYGGDPQAIALMGHSAGAGIVALIGTDESFLGAHGLALGSLRCVGSFDTESYDIPRTLKTSDATQTTLYQNAFGTDPAVLANASPINHLQAAKGIPPFLIVKRGAADRKALEQDFADAITAIGVWSKVIDASSLTHEEVNEHIGMAGDTVMTAPVQDFVKTVCFP
jgi:arylformamidase